MGIGAQQGALSHWVDSGRFAHRSRRLSGRPWTLDPYPADCRRPAQVPPLAARGCAAHGPLGPSWAGPQVSRWIQLFAVSQTLRFQCPVLVAFVVFQSQNFARMASPAAVPAAPAVAACNQTCAADCAPCLFLSLQLCQLLQQQRATKAVQPTVPCRSSVSCSFASHVFLMEPIFNGADEEQARMLGTPAGC